MIRSAQSERTIKATDFFKLPRESMVAENVLQPGEVLTEVVIPSVPTHSATIELREKQSFDWPMAMASVGGAGAGQVAGLFRRGGAGAVAESAGDGRAGLVGRHARACGQGGRCRGTRGRTDVSERLQDSTDQGRGEAGATRPPPAWRLNHEDHPRWSRSEPDSESHEHRPPALLRPAPLPRPCTTAPTSARANSTNPTPPSTGAC